MTAFDWFTLLLLAGMAAIGRLDCWPDPDSPDSTDSPKIVTELLILS